MNGNPTLWKKIWTFIKFGKKKDENNCKDLQLLEKNNLIIPLEEYNKTIKRLKEKIDLLKKDIANLHQLIEDETQRNIQDNNELKEKRNNYDQICKKLNGINRTKRKSKVFLSQMGIDSFKKLNQIVKDICMDESDLEVLKRDELNEDTVNNGYLFRELSAQNFLNGVAKEYHFNTTTFESNSTMKIGRAHV